MSYQQQQKRSGAKPYFRRKSLLKEYVRVKRRSFQNIREIWGIAQLGEQAIRCAGPKSPQNFAAAIALCAMSAERLTKCQPPTLSHSCPLLYLSSGMDQGQAYQMHEKGHQEMNE